MKKALIFIAAAFFMLNIKAQETENQDAPVMTFETETIKYGNIEKDSDGTRVFKFTNTGKSPLKITRVKPTCSCTVPSYPKTEIMPGESGEIAVEYNTSKPGRFSKSIKVFTNTTKGKIILRISGNVLK